MDYIDNLVLDEIDDIEVSTNAGPLPIALIANALQFAKSRGLTRIFRRKEGGTKVGNFLRSVFKRGASSNTSSSSVPSSDLSLSSQTVPSNTNPSNLVSSTDMKKNKWYFVVGGALLLVVVLFFVIRGKKRRRF